MIGAWFASLFSGIWKWLVGIGAVLAALAAAYYLGHRKEADVAHDAAVAHDAEQQLDTAKQTIEHLQIKDQVHEEVQALPTPSSDPRSVASAPADSAAGKLRTDWERPADSK